jgi:predicted dehydrogenase
MRPQLRFPGRDHPGTGVSVPLKPGITSLAQLAEVRKVQAETKRIYSICYSEHFQVRSTVHAGELVRAGAIGRLVNTVGLGPHRLTNAPRPPWFFQREKYGGVLTDIGSHQCEQFLFFADVNGAEVASATVKNTSNPQTPELQDFGEMLVRTPGKSPATSASTGSRQTPHRCGATAG